MPERVSSLDASLLFLDEPNLPMHVGSVMLFEPPADGFTHADLVSVVRARLAFAPHYRQRVKAVPLGLARPVWVDDVHFDLTYHVRRTSLPKPGTREQLDEFVGRIMGRPLDRDRPLWEMVLVEGLADGRLAIITKTHQALVDGLTSIDLLQVILERSGDTPHESVDAWSPAAEPTGVELMSAALTESLVHPSVAIETARNAAGAVSALAGAVGGRVWEALGSVVSIARPTPSSVLHTTVGPRRRFASAEIEFRTIHDLHVTLDASVNDILLCILTGALRAWLLGRGVPITGRSQLRAVVPFSTRDPQAPVSAFFLDLPTGEADPVVRLRQLQYETAKLTDVAQLLGAEAIINAVGFGPATLHALGARLASNISSRTYNLAVTNVPGPQSARYLHGARLVATYPVMPLTKSQSLSIGMTSYDGRVFTAVNADHDAVPDLADLIADMYTSLAELQAAASVQ